MAQHDPYYTTTPTPAVAPESVRNAIRLIWVNVGLSLVSGLLSFVLIHDIIDATSGSGGVVDEDAIRVAAVVGIVVGLIIGVAIAALFAYFIGKGANWARIVYTVFAVLGLVFGLVGIGNTPGLLVVISLISSVVTIAVLFLLYRPESNRYFAR